MTGGRVLESCRIRNKRIGPTGRRRRRPDRARAMTDFAVVIVLRLIVRTGTGERSPHERQILIDNQTTEDSRDHVLMLIVWKLNQKLAGNGRIAKRETGVVPRRYLRVAVTTNYRSRAFEKMLTMTTHAGIMTGKVCNVGKLPDLFPVSGRNLMAGVTGTLMFFCGVGESGIVNRRQCWTLHRRFTNLSLLRLGCVAKANSGKACHRTEDCQEN